MGQSRWKNRWRRLDNTAKIFPVIANENVSQVFRISATLKEPVNPEAPWEGAGGNPAGDPQFPGEAAQGTFLVLF